MALVPKIQTDTTLLWDVTRKTIKVSDATGDYNATTNPTGYGGANPTKASITNTRQILSSYISSIDAGAVTENYIPNQEYKNNGSTPAVFDVLTNPKNASTLQTYFPTNIEPITGTIANTGRWRTIVNFVPNASPSYVISNTQFGFTADQVFPDGIYTIVTDYFQNTPIASGSLSSGTDYIVAGTGDPAITYGAVGTAPVYGVFGEGEVFTVGSATTWGIDQGTPAVYQKIGTSSYSFLIANDSFIKVQDVQTKNRANRCKCGDTLTQLIYDIDDKYSTLLKCVTPNYFNPSLAQTLIDQIAQDYNYIINSFCS